MICKVVEYISPTPAPWEAANVVVRVSTRITCHTPAAAPVQQVAATMPVAASGGSSSLLELVAFLLVVGLLMFVVVGIVAGIFDAMGSSNKPAPAPAAPSMATATSNAYRQVDTLSDEHIRAVANRLFGR